MRQLTLTNDQFDFKGGNPMRQLTLTNDQFEYLFAHLEEVVEYLEGEMTTTEDDNGNEVLEDINQYEAYQIYQKLVSLKNEPKVTITPQQLEGDISTVTDDDYADKVDRLVDNMVAHDDNVFTHDSEGC